jgi:hypothetical protein
VLISASTKIPGRSDGKDDSQRRSSPLARHGTCESSSWVQGVNNRQKQIEKLKKSKHKISASFKFSHDKDQSDVNNPLVQYPPSWIGFGSSSDRF